MDIQTKDKIVTLEVLKAVNDSNKGKIEEIKGKVTEQSNKIVELSQKVNSIEVGGNGVTQQMAQTLWNLLQKVAFVSVPTTEKQAFYDAWFNQQPTITVSQVGTTLNILGYNATNVSQVGTSLNIN